MRSYQYLIVGLLFVVMSVALLGVRIYDTRQSEITREGNHLLTQRMVAFSGTAQEARTLLDESLGHYSIFRDLDDGGAIRAVDSDRLDLLELPIHEGRSFRRGEQHVALVGDQVPVTRENGVSVYELDRVGYEVIGRLGRDNRSLLANDVIVADRDIVDSPNLRSGVILDGPAMEDQAAALPADKVTRSDASVNRRARVDLVSPVVDFVVVAVVGICAVFTGILASQLSRRTFRVGFLVGRSPLRMFTVALMALLLTAAVGAGLSLTAGQHLFTELRSSSGITVVAPVVIAVLAFTGGSSIELLRMRKWR